MSEAGQWFLFHVYNDKANHLVCNAVESLDKQHVKKLQEAKNGISEYFRAQNVVEAAFANRNDILEALVMMAKAYDDNPQYAEPIMERASFDISRRFANTCSMFRSFIDHYDRYFVHTHGKTSKQYRDWKTAQSNEYDESISYRIVSVIRNYIQHYDMPPLSLSISDKAGEKGFSTRVDIDVGQLMKDDFVRSKLSRKIDQNSRHMPILKILDDWSECYKRIVKFANAIRIKDALPFAQEIVKTRTRLKVGDRGKLSLSWLPNAKSKPDKLDLKFDWLQEEKARFIIDEAI